MNLNNLRRTVVGYIRNDLSVAGLDLFSLSFFFLNSSDSAFNSVMRSSANSILCRNFQLLRHRGGNDHSSDTEESFLASLPFEAGFPLRILTYMTVLWVIEFLYLRFHIFVIPILIRGVAYLIFALTIDALCYYICSDLALGKFNVRSHLLLFRYRYCYRMLPFTYCAIVYKNCISMECR